MAGPPWFYYPFEEIDMTTLELSGGEVTHILGARRLRPGDELVLMNGKGEMAHCVLDEADKKAKTIKLTVSLLAKLEPPEKGIILASAIPKGDRLSTMLDMASQLGMTQFQPLHFEHSVREWSDHLKQRCERILIEACKQSKSARVPIIRPICRYQEFLETENEGRDLTLLADQFGRPLASYVSEIEKAQDLRIIVGPEGGLSASEINHAQQYNIASLRLATSILRIETAAIAAVTVLQGYSIANG